MHRSMCTTDWGGIEPADVSSHEEVTCAEACMLVAGRTDSCS